MSRANLVMALASLWSDVTDLDSSVVPAGVVAAALRKQTGRVVEVMITYGLAEDAGNGRLDLDPLCKFFGPFDWLRKLRESSGAGGSARAASATRDPETGQMLARDYRAEILQLLADQPVNSRSALARALHADRGRVGAVLDALIAAGDVVQTPGGFFVRPDDTRQTTGPDDTLPSGRAASALVPALAPTPSESHMNYTRQHVPPGNPDDSLQSPDDRPDDSSRAAAPLLAGLDEVRPASVTGERAHEEQLAKRVIGWLNELHRKHGRLQGHRGFDALARDVLQAARRWRKAKLSPEEVIAVCDHRIAQWRALSGDWLDNCTPQVLFRPNKFDAALQEVRAGHSHHGDGMSPGAQVRRHGARPLSSHRAASLAELQEAERELGTWQP